MLKARYFEKDLSQGFVALLSGRLVQSVADNLINLFLPIFLFIKLGHDFKKVLLFFGVSWLAYALLLPLGAQILDRIGLNRSIRIGVIFDALTLTCFYFLDKDQSLFLSLAMVTRTLNFLLFWIPYHTDFSKFTDKEDRGREYSLIGVVSTIMGIVLPVVSGFLISRYGFHLVFILGVLLTLAVYLPYLLLPPTREKFSWNYRETLRHFFAKRNRKLVLAQMASGAENLVGGLIWPIFIWLIMRGRYLEVGAISTLIAGVTVILQLLVGRLTDKINKRKLLRWGSLFYSFGWIVKMIIASAFQIFLAGVYHNFASIFIRTPFDSLTYELAADQGHYVDEFTVLKEMAVQFGRVLMIILLFYLLTFISIKWTFALAALMSLAFNLIPEEELLDIRTAELA